MRSQVVADVRPQCWFHNSCTFTATGGFTQTIMEMYSFICLFFIWCSRGVLGLRYIAWFLHHLYWANSQVVFTYACIHIYLHMCVHTCQPQLVLSYSIQFLCMVTSYQHSTIKTVLTNSAPENLHLQCPNNMVSHSAPIHCQVQSSTCRANHKIQYRASHLHRHDSIRLLPALHGPPIYSLLPGHKYGQWEYFIKVGVFY